MRKICRVLLVVVTAAIVPAAAPVVADEQAKSGANRPGLDWWSLRKIVRPVPPAPFSPQRAGLRQRREGEVHAQARGADATPLAGGSGENWVRTPIDAFILAKLQAAGLTPVPEADRATLIRRAKFDLLGLPPTPEEVQSFVNDPAPDAYERLIDEFLASPHYGERWGRHWLDVIRFGESAGYEMNTLRFNAWPYRDYVIRAFNKDTPFPQFVLEQLAGDTIPNADWLTQSATSFLVTGTHDNVTNQTPEGAAQQRMDDLDDMITATGTAFLGLTANCARCHDHKFDPITQRDYYGLQAVFAGVQHRERDIPVPQLKELEPLASLTPSLKIYAGTFTQPEETHILMRGDPMRKKEKVAPSAIEAVSPSFKIDPKSPERERRLALARWIGHRENPLPARVMVNRIWHYHFGQGIVNTPSDFGFQGDRPSHPELLDWLAREYIDNGWRLKPLHRLIMLSSVYRQSGSADAKGLDVDKQNRLLWRFSPRRLDAESIRDSILCVNGKLDLRMGGPGYNLWEKNTNYVVVFKPKSELGQSEFRRMAYQFRPRAQHDPTFGAFDCPENAMVAPKRNASITSLQALNLLNSNFMVRQGELFAERLRREAGDNPGKQVERAFWLAFGRGPSESELADAVALTNEHGTAALCRALYNASEFVYVR